MFDDSEHYAHLRAQAYDLFKIRQVARKARRRTISHQIFPIIFILV
jgi:hypothetical protein